MKLIVYALLFQFCLGSLIPKTDFSQLTKLGFLLEHYNLHLSEAQEMGASFDVFDFIYIHYISPDGHTHDIPVDHNNLPAKHLSFTLDYCINGIQSFSTDILPCFEQNVFIIESLEGKSILQSIFHPPSA